MNLFNITKDGGQDSNVWAYWLVELKSLFSIAFLKFEHGTREAFHNHAFNCISWVICGKLEEKMKDGGINFYHPSFKPIVTKRETFHKVFSHGRTWVFTLRGPWVDRWKESHDDKETTLTHGRKQV